MASQFHDWIDVTASEETTSCEAASTFTASAMEDREWVQCDKCRKWRGLKPEDFSRVVQKETWLVTTASPTATGLVCLCRYCYQHPEPAQGSCDVPQILTDSEIDAIYRKREIAKAKKLLVRPVIWQEIQGNVYTYRRRKSCKEDDIAICQCRPVAGKGCLENCINRMLNIECTQGLCPCGAACTNQRFTLRQQAAVEIRRAGMKGFGLFCKEIIKEGDFVTEYMGEIVDEMEYLRRRTFYADNGHKHYYFMQIGNGEVIDACRMGNTGRFMNHSCDPNCETQKWVVKGDLRVGFFALRDIQAGEELTFNYNFQTEKPIRCCCGSTKCTGTIGGQKCSNDLLQEHAEANEATRESMEVSEVPDPIMIRDDEVDDVMRVILAHQVGINDDMSCSGEQIRVRLNDLYRKHGLEQLANSLDADMATDSGSKTMGTREISSGESSERRSSCRDSASRLSGRKKARGRGRAAMAGALAERRAGRVAWSRAKVESDRRRSEVDASLDDIAAASGKLYNPSRKNILRVLRLFNLIEIGMNEKERQEAEQAREKAQKTREELERSGQIYLGTVSRSQPRQQPIYVAGYCINEISVEEASPTRRQRARFADLSLLLDVVQHTIDPVARSLFVECGILSQLQQVIGRNFAPQYSVMLRKILRVVDCLPLQKSDFQMTRSAHGTMENLITALTHHKDNGVRSIALSIARQHNLDMEPRQKQRQSAAAASSTPNSNSALTETKNVNQESTDLRSSRGSASLSRDAQDDCRGSRSHAQARVSSGGHSSVPPPPPPPPPLYKSEFMNGAMPPPPPPPPTSKERTRTDLSGIESSGSLSLPPGFGCFKTQSARDRDPDIDGRRQDRSSTVHESHSRECSRRDSPSSRRSSLKRKKEIRRRIVRKLHESAMAKEGSFSKELGKLQHMSEQWHQEILAKEARDLEEERQKCRRLASSIHPEDHSCGPEPEGWDHLNRDFEDFVRQTLRQRIQKYQQPEHPLRLTAAEAESLFKKLYASIMESEENAFRTFARDRVRRHVSKMKLALNIKEFTSKTMHNYYDSARSHVKAENSVSNDNSNNNTDD